MSIATEISRIQQAKADIKSSIEAKGVTVPSAALIDDYSDYVDAIQTGGGGGTPIAESVDVSNYKDGGNFNFLAQITDVNWPSGIHSIGNYSFQNCSGLTSITIPNSVTSISSSAFKDCDGLTSITIPSSVTGIGAAAFSGCNSLTSITIPSGVTSINSYVFQYCVALTSITIPSGVTRIAYNAFERCRGLTSITIPSSVTDIGNNAFKDCSGLTSITIEATTPPALASNVFNNTNDCPIYVPAESVDAYKAANNWSTYASRIQAIPSE